MSFETTVYLIYGNEPLEGDFFFNDSSKKLSMKKKDLEREVFFFFNEVIFVHGIIL